MAKKTYKILRFDGGINDNSDPRDIADNQFVTLQNVAVDNVGKLVILGDVRTQRLASVVGHTSQFTGNGDGMFAFSSDKTGLITGSISSSGRTYFLTERDDTVEGKSSDGSEQGSLAVTLGASGVAWVFANGALRVWDGDHDGGSSGDVPLWRGYIPAKTYGTAGTDIDVNISEQWYTHTAEVKGAFPEYTVSGTTFCKNAIVANGSDGSGGTGYRPINFDQLVSSGNASTADTDYNGVAAEGASAHQWGVHLGFDEDNAGTGSGTWMPTAETRYKFYITTMYDDHTQESLPQLMQMWGSDLLDSVNTYHGDTVQSEMQLTNGDTFGTTGVGVALWMKPLFKWNHNTYATNGTYNFGADNPGDTSSGNFRISGVRIYWSSNEDGYSSLWQIFDAKFDEGVKVIGVDGAGGGTAGYSPFIEDGTYDNHATITFSTSNVWTDPPRFIEYSAINGHSHTDVIKLESCKTAVLANRRIYAGNIGQDGKLYPDRMVKSPVNQFDKFPSVNNIDVSIHDGDEIIKLVEFADRILQFKKNTMYIINISGNTEYLEGEFKFKGIFSEGAVTRTDYGVVWVNNLGCYMYDGRSVTDLLDDGGIRKIKASTWSTFIGTDGKERVGFNPFKKQIIVKQGTDAEGGYIYDMVTKSWVYSTFVVQNGPPTYCPNFINDPTDGALCMYDGVNDTLDVWSDTPFDSEPSINITTKDFDFGEPSVNKKVYKVYITYKANDSVVPTVTYDTDGNTGLTEPTIATTPFTNTSGQWTRAEYRFNSDANNCKSMQLKIAGDTHREFEINDITFIYRIKSIK